MACSTSFFLEPEEFFLCFGIIQICSQTTMDGCGEFHCWMKQQLKKRFKFNSLLQCMVPLKTLSDCVVVSPISRLLAL